MVGDVDIVVEASAEKQGNYYSNMPTIRSSAAGAMSDIVKAADKSTGDQFDKSSTSSRTTKAAAYQRPGWSAATLSLSDNSGEYAEIYDSTI